MVKRRRNPDRRPRGQRKKQAPQVAQRTPKPASKSTPPSHRHPKPIWVFACGTYRSASTTQYQITRDIVETTGNGVGIGYHQEKKLRDFDVEGQQKGHKFIVCKVFMFLPETSPYGAAFLREQRLRAVCTVRDPRDIITSMRERHKRHMEDPNHQKVAFDFDHRVTHDFPQWLGQLTQWIDLGEHITYCSRYEVFTEDLYSEVVHIAAHLGIPLNERLARSIAARYEKDAIMTAKRDARARGKKEDPWLPSVPGILFGQPGSHEFHLSKEERELVEVYNGGFMKRFGYLEEVSGKG